MSRPAVLAVLGLVAVAVGVVYSLTWDRNDSGRISADPADDPADVGRLDAVEARLAELETSLRRIADYRAIIDNEMRYTRGLDRHDERLITDSFWPDAEASYGTLVDIEGLAVWANAGHARSAAHQHHLTAGVTLDIDGDKAHEEGYILFSSDMRRDTSFDSAGQPTPGRVVAGSLSTLGTGRYVNRYERRDGEWRMIVHEYVHDISLPLEAVDLCATGCIGRWDASDISYMRPLQPLSSEERAARSAQGMTPRTRLAPADGTENGN